MFGNRYMHLRRLTEGRLYDLFRMAGGRPQRKTPHDFVLGSCEWYRGLAPDTHEIVLPLVDLLWQRLLGRPVSESGRLHQGPTAINGATAAGAC